MKLTTPKNEKFYLIALLEIPHIGLTIAKKLIKKFGSAEQVLSLSSSQYQTLGSIGYNIIEAKQKGTIFNTAQLQLDYCFSNAIEILSYYDHHYPKRLKHCPDAPLILYFKGHCDFNNTKVIAIVGTRNATPYGKDICNKIVEELAKKNVLIISGLAYGIDITAHQKAVKSHTPTIGVLAHGLDSIYPKAHHTTAQEMLTNGGLLTEHKINTRPSRENFPKRNRIVAGLSDAIIVIESAITGGSMITAKLGNDYNRDVFAIPGRIGANYSEGCNHLIKTNQAHLLQTSKDIAYILGWKTNTKKPSTIQKQLFISLTPEEDALMNLLQKHQRLSMDELAVKTSLPISQVSPQLLLLEFKGLIHQLPGNIYEVI
ncbi:MAG: DNA-processing protein DprA [Flavobacteriales bacterium]|jgi:DNA processing protein|nr:DNA-processing protein DprA [Flavobacteriales bacterium]